MVESSHPQDLSIACQCKLLGISRSSFYYEAKGENPLNLKLMRMIDEQFLETPWYGSRQMARWLRREGHRVGRKRVVRLMRKMGLTPIYQKPSTSKPQPGHKIYPYLLREVEITEPGHVWCADVSYSAPSSWRWHGDVRRDLSMTGIHMDRARRQECPVTALCCERARAEAAVTCRTLAG